MCVVPLLLQLVLIYQMLQGLVLVGLMVHLIKYISFQGVCCACSMPAAAANTLSLGLLPCRPPGTHQQDSGRVHS
jgi:hypothetical protein